MQTILSEERRQKTRQAFIRWYGKQEKKSAALRALGNYDDCYGAIWSTKGPPVHALVALFKETKDPDFLLTRAEKEVCRTRLPRTRPYLDLAEWPDFELVKPAQQEDKLQEETVEVDLKDVMRRIKELSALLKKLSQLPRGHFKRKEAKRLLVEPAMELFEAITHLRVDFPQIFQDLLHQLAVATRLGEKP